METVTRIYEERKAEKPSIRLPNLSGQFAQLFLQKTPEVSVTTPVRTSLVGNSEKARRLKSQQSDRERLRRRQVEQQSQNIMRQDNAMIHRRQEAEREGQVRRAISQRQEQVMRETAQRREQFVRAAARLRAATQKGAEARRRAAKQWRADGDARRRTSAQIWAHAPAQAEPSHEESGDTQVTNSTDASPGVKDAGEVDMQTGDKTNKPAGGCTRQ